MMEHHNATEDDISVDDESMQRVIDVAQSVKPRAAGVDTTPLEESGMWCMDEELVVWKQPTEQLPPSNSFGYLRGCGYFGALMSLAVALVRSLRPMLNSKQNFV